MPNDTDFVIQALVALWYTAVYNKAASLAGNAADASDLTQETFVVATERISQLRNEPSAALPWLLQILRTIARKEWKNKSKTVAMVEDVADDREPWIFAERDDLLALGKGLSPAISEYFTTLVRCDFDRDNTASALGITIKYEQRLRQEAKLQLEKSFGFAHGQNAYMSALNAYVKERNESTLKALYEEACSDEVRRLVTFRFVLDELRVMAHFVETACKQFILSLAPAINAWPEHFHVTEEQKGRVTDLTTRVTQEVRRAWERAGTISWAIVDKSIDVVNRLYNNVLLPLPRCDDSAYPHLVRELRTISADTGLWFRSKEENVGMAWIFIMLGIAVLIQLEMKVALLRPITSAEKDPPPEGSG